MSDRPHDNEQEPDDDAPQKVEIGMRDLSADALRAVVTEFVTREGTDYGHADFTLEDKISAVIEQLKRGEAQIVFDPATETTTLLARP